MFPTLQQFIDGIKGGSGLLFWDDEALDRFDQSISGFWKSFSAPIAAFPAYMVYVLAGHAARIEGIANLPDGQTVDALPPTQVFVTAACLTYILGVILFPLVMIPFTKQLGLTHRFVPFIIARNWINAVVTFLLAAPSLLYLAGVLGPAATLGLTMLLSFAAFAGLYFAALSALQCARLWAVMTVLIDAAIGILFIQLSLAILT